MAVWPQIMVRVTLRVFELIGATVRVEAIFAPFGTIG
jgi:Holliday junction resolvasome RuvABC ATP-dependent DNA helicase subunit